MGMTFEEKGAYIELLMMQFNRGHMTSHMIGHTLGQNGGQIWDKIKDKFRQDEEGLYYNERLEHEIKKRQAFVKSRANNLSGKNQYGEKSGKKSGHMGGQMTSDMENGNIDIDDNTDSDRKEIGVQGEEEGKKVESLKAVFEIFRQAYPGDKRGLETEFGNLKRKHDDWAEIVPLLYDALSYQVKARENLIERNAFVPAWRKLQTWLNQRCWEEEISINQPIAAKRNGSTAESAVAHAQSLMGGL